MANIYELTNDWQTVYQMIDDEEVPEDVLIDTLESIEGEIEYKADGYAMVIKNIQSDIDGLDNEIKRLQQRKTTMENSIECMKNNLYSTMKTIGRPKFKTKLFSFNIQKNGGKRGITLTKDISEIPIKYRVKQPDKINNDAIRDMFKEQGVERCDFAVLEPQSESLRIR